MAQASQRFCPQCGTPLEPSQRFCSNCGATADFNAANPTEHAPDQRDFTPQSDPTVPPPPPPPAADLYTQPAQPQPVSYTQYPQQAPQPPPSYQQAPVYARPQKDSSKGVLGQIGCGVVLVILVILVICGAIGYFGWQFLANAAQTSTTTPTTGGSTGTNTGNTGGGHQILATAQINQAVTYSGIKITIMNVQQAASFADDNSTSSSSGTIRLNTREENISGTSVSRLYSDVAHLILPDKTSVTIENDQKYVPPDRDVTQTNWWDFLVPTNIKISDLTLRFGTDSEAQMDIPLTGKADLSQYQSKTSTPNVQTQYQGLTWTVTQAILSWSAEGQQADKGMRYVTVTLKIDNPSSQDVNAYWPDYLRLKAGDITSEPKGSTTIPTSIPASSTGKTGSASFLVPEGNSSYTLIFLGNATAGISQASVNFQI